MANCNRCGEVIFFAWHEHWLKWLPCELVSIRDEDVELEIGGKPGLRWEKHHQRHRCGFKATRDEWAAGSLVGSGPHAALFVTADAPIEVIRAAYKALAMLYHPDHGGDPQRMVELNRAYEEVTKI